MSTIFTELARCARTEHEGNQTIRRAGFRDVVVLSGNDVTESNGARRINLTESFFLGMTAGLPRYVGVFNLPTPAPFFPEEYFPIRVVFESPQPHVIATASLSTSSPMVSEPIFLTAEIEATPVSGQSDLDLESLEQIVTWPLGEVSVPIGGQFIFDTKPEDLFFLSLVFRAWKIQASAGRSAEPIPMRGVDFSWQLRGTMRYISKRTKP